MSVVARRYRASQVFASNGIKYKSGHLKRKLVDISMRFASESDCMLEPNFSVTSCLTVAICLFGHEIRI